MLSSGCLAVGIWMQAGGISLALLRLRAKLVYLTQPGNCFLDLQLQVSAGFGICSLCCSVALGMSCKPGHLQIV